MNTNDLPEFPWGELSYMLDIMLKPSKDENIIPYFFHAETRAVLFFHSDITDSWWNRGRSSSERDMQKIESLIQAATGLKRVYRKNHELVHIVEFRLSEKHYKTAAVALRISFTPDMKFQRMFERFIEKKKHDKQNHK